MPRPIFPQNVVAVVWDFDKTLSPAYMQVPLFERYGVNGEAFWAEVNQLPELLSKQGDATKSSGALRVNQDTIYLNRILDYVRAGIFQGLTNGVLRELGAALQWFPGLPDALPRLQEFVAGNDRFTKFEIRLEHYIVSTGLREMIVGSAIHEFVDGVWGCEFAESSPEPLAHISGDSQLSVASAASPVIEQVAYAIDNTSKTRAIFEINKGSNKYPSEIDVNSFMRPEDRRVPISNMIYIADGPSDTPVFSVVVNNGGKALAVYPEGDRSAFRQANELQVQGRVHAVAEADYREGSHASLWLETEIDRIAQRIVDQRDRELKEQVGRPPRHLSTNERTAEHRGAIAAEPAGAEADVPVRSGIEVSAGEAITIDTVRQKFAIANTEPESIEAPAGRSGRSRSSPKAR